MVAAVVGVEGVEWDEWLCSLSGHESCTAGERDLVDDERTSVTTVADDVDSGRVVDEVLGESLESKLVRVVLNEAAEDLGTSSGLLVVQAERWGWRRRRAVSASGRWRCWSRWLRCVLLALAPFAVAIALPLVSPDWMLWCWSSESSSSKSRRSERHGGEVHLD